MPASNLKPQTSNLVKPRGGFTLLEFLIYFALIAVMMTVITAFSIDVIKTRNKAAVISEVEQNARFALMRILRSGRQATGINNAGSTFNATNGVLSLNQDAAAANPTVFDLSGGVLRIKEGAATATPLTSPDVTVTKLYFTKDSLPGGGKSVTVQMDIEYAANSADKNFDYTVSTSGTATIRKD